MDADFDEMKIAPLFAVTERYAYNKHGQGNFRNSLEYISTYNSSFVGGSA